MDRPDAQDSQHGDQVFDAEKECAGKLQELIKKKKTTIPGATLQAFINRITGADRLLVLVAISDAQQRRPDPKRIAKAGEELAKGDSDLLKGNYSDAIDHYSNAWKLVM